MKEGTPFVEWYTIRDTNEQREKLQSLNGGETTNYRI